MRDRKRPDPPALPLAKTWHSRSTCRLRPDRRKQRAYRARRIGANALGLTLGTHLVGTLPSARWHEVASSAPPPPAEAVKPPEPGPIQTQVRAPSEDGKDAGEVISGWYDIQNGQVVVWERSGGAPIGRAAYNPGDDPKVIARRLLREKRGGSSCFYGPISYRTH